MNDGSHDWRSQLMTHAGNSPEIAVSLCDAFLQEVPALLTKISQCLDGIEVDDIVNDPRGQLFLPIHTLKSCLRYVAPSSDVQLAADLEKQVASETVAVSGQFRDDYEKLESTASNWVSRVRALRAELATEQ